MGHVQDEIDNPGNRCCNNDQPGSYACCSADMSSDTRLAPRLKCWLRHLDQDLGKQPGNWIV